MPLRRRRRKEEKEEEEFIYHKYRYTSSFRLIYMLVMGCRKSNSHLRTALATHVRIIMNIH